MYILNNYIKGIMVENGFNMLMEIIMGIEDLKLLKKFVYGYTPCLVKKILKEILQILEIYMII